MSWYLIHTKPRLEECALENLQNQGYACFLPQIRVEKLRRGKLVEVDEPLFPRYFFIQLDTGKHAQSWHPIRSTKGVSRLVTLGTEPAKVATELIDALRAHNDAATHIQPLFAPGERVQIKDGPFAGLEAIYQFDNGERRAMVLIELLNKPSCITLAPASLRKL
jgi:transcriptional antiterminator RfaH